MNDIESSEQPQMHHHTLQCSEVWSGYRAIENSVLSTGLKAWIWSTPYQDDSEGGDVHYLSLCSGGIVTRVVLADVCGHGSAVGAISEKLCNLLRRFMNAKKQDQVVSVINREFTQVTKDFRFATAVLVTYEHHRKRLQFSNAGHPPPLFLGVHSGKWTFLDVDEMASTDDVSEVTEGASNLPFGIDVDAQYDTHVQSIAAGDRLILYTDAFMEAHERDGEMLGAEGFLAMAQSLSDEHPELNCESFGRTLLDRFRDRFGATGDDDQTLVVIDFGEGRGGPSVVERLAGYGRFIKSRLA